MVGMVAGSSVKVIESPQTGAAGGFVLGCFTFVDANNHVVLRTLSDTVVLTGSEQRLK